MKVIKISVSVWTLLMVFATGISVQAATVWKGAVDDNWSTSGNWSAGVPGTEPIAQFDGTDTDGLINVDTATTGLQKLQFLSAAKEFVISGGPMNFADGQGDIILHSGSNMQTFNSDIFIDASLQTLRSFRFGNYSGQLIMNGDVVQNTNSFRFTKGKVTMNGSFSGDEFIFNEGSHTFANTTDNDFNTIKFANATDVTVNTAEGTVFFDGDRMFFNTDGAKMTFNNANVLGDNTGLTIGDAANSATLVFNANETLGSVNASGLFVIDLGAAVDNLAFADSSSEGWTSGMVITNFRSGVVRFGTDANGITGTQLDLISAFSADGSDVSSQLTVDGSGYLIPEPTTIGFITASSILILFGRRLFVM